MAINYAHLRSLTARELISGLARDGFVLDRQAGAHQLYLHPDGRRVPVSFHRAGNSEPLPRRACSPRRASRRHAREGARDPGDPDPITLPLVSVPPLAMA